MKSVPTALFILLLPLCLICLNTASASWIAVTPEDLIGNSDVILVGEIIGPIGEEKNEGSWDSWITYWKVDVYYYLKGNVNSKEFIVATPGAQNKPEFTSNDYRLDQWGGTVLLFLQKIDNTYTPITPQGIVFLKKNNYTPKPEEPLDGELLLKQFTITNSRLNVRNEFEKYILEKSNIIEPGSRSQGPLSIKQLLPNFTTWFITFLALITTGLVFFIRRRRYKS